MSDILKIELEVDDNKATVKFGNVEKTAKKTVSEINKADKSLTFGKSLVNNLEETERKISSFNSKFNSLVLGFVGFGAVIGGTTQLIGTAIGKTNEAIRANRLLASSATEAGIAYEVLAEKNRKVAETFGLSDVAASSVTAKIQQLATFAGNPQQFDTIAKRFADLGAAKGIGSDDMSVLIGTILSGQDEGLNRLGISDPGKLYAEYAKQIGKTAESLSKFERVQALVNAVVEKGAIFDGTAVARMKSLEGQTAKAAATWENFTNNVSQATTNNLYFQNSVDLINKALGTMSFNIDEIKKKLKDGWTPEQIAVEEQNSFWNQSLGAISSLGNTAFGLGFVPFDIYNDGFGAAWDKYKAGVSNPRYMLQQQRADQIRNQTKLDDSQSKDAANQKIINDLDTNTSDFNSRIESFVKSLGNSSLLAKTELTDLNKLQKELISDTQKLSESERKRRQELINNSARDFFDKDAKYNIDFFMQNPDREGALNNLRTLDSIQSKLSEDNYTSLRIKLTKYLEDDLEKSQKKIEDWNKNITSIFDDTYSKFYSDNPLTKAFTDGEKALHQLQEKLKDLPPELRKIGQEAVLMQQKMNEKAMFGASLDNQLSAFSLRNDASNFRNPFDPAKLQKDQNEFVDDYLRRNPNYLFLKGRNYLDDETRKEILSFGNFDTQEKRLNEQLNKQFNLVFGQNLNADQQALSDKRFLALTQGVNPLELDSTNRERAAQVREREAIRVENYQNENLKIQRESLEVNKKIEANQKKLIQIAEKQGLQGVNSTITVKTEDGTQATLDKAPTPASTQLLYGDSRNGLSNW